MALYDKTVSLEEMEREMNNMKEQIRQYDMDKIRKEILEKGN